MVAFASQSRRTWEYGGIACTTAVEDPSGDGQANKANEDDGEEDFTNVREWLRGQIRNGADGGCGDDDENDCGDGDEVEDAFGNGEDTCWQARGEEVANTRDVLALRSMR